MKIPLQMYLARVRMTFSKILRTAFGEGGVRGFPKRLVAGMRQGFRTVSKDPIHGPTLRAARYESIDGANEIGWGTALLCFALPSYTYLVFPPSSIWKARLGWLLLVCAALAPFGCRWFIKRFITWPRTGYVAFRRDRKFWIAIGMSVIVSAVLGAVLPWLMMTEIARRTQSEMRQEGAPLSPINTNKLSRAYLGVRLQSLSPNAAKPIQRSRQKPGVLVEGVVPNSAADKAGIKPGDVILQFNGRQVSEVRELMSLISEMPLRTKIDLRIRQAEAGKQPVERTVTAFLNELPHERIAPANRGSMRLSLKIMLGVFLASNALLYPMMAGASLWEHSWKWVFWLVMILGSMGIALVVPGGLMDRMPPLMLFLGWVWLLSGGATLCSYLHHTQPPALDPV